MNFRSAGRPGRLKAFSDDQLKHQLERLVRQERKITALLLEHILEVENRDLHLRWGYESLYAYLTQALGYSEAAAYRRIQAARALRQVPELHEKIESGELKLSQVAKVQSCLRAEEKLTGEKVPHDQQKQIFSEIAGQTTVETERILNRHFTLSAAQKPTVEVTHQANDSVELRLQVSKLVYEQLQRVRELYGHIRPGANWVEVLELMAQDVIRKRDPLRASTLDPAPAPAPGSASASSPAFRRGPRADRPERHGKSIVTRSFAEAEVGVSGAKTKPESKLEERSEVQIEARPSRSHLPVSLRRQVLQRDLARCQYPRLEGGVCGSRFQIEVDHIIPKALGGADIIENLRCLCRRHNAFHAQQAFGTEFMNQWAQNR